MFFVKTKICVLCVGADWKQSEAYSGLSCGGGGDTEFLKFPLFQAFSRNFDNPPLARPDYAPGSNNKRSPAPPLGDGLSFNKHITVKECTYSY